MLNLSRSAFAVWPRTRGMLLGGFALEAKFGAFLHKPSIVRLRIVPRVDELLVMSWSSRRPTRLFWLMARIEANRPRNPRRRAIG